MSNQNISPSEWLSQVDTQLVGELPAVLHYLERLDIPDLLSEYLPSDPRDEMPIAQVVVMLIANLVSARRPLWKVSDFLKDYMDGMDVEADRSAPYTDDRLAIALDRVFQCDRGSLMMELSGRAIETFELETDVMHSDTSTLTVQGAYEEDEEDSGEAVRVTHGHNKDHRPDLKQVVFGVVTTEDGQVPLLATIEDGNASDSQVARDLWRQTRQLLAEEEFVFVGDSKTCNLKTLQLIDGRGGKFITLMPATWKDVGVFKERLKNKQLIAWKEVLRRESSRKMGEFDVYGAYETKTSRGDFRLIWIHSTGKAQRDRQSREKQVARIGEELGALAGKLNKYHLKTREAVEAAAAEIVSGGEEFFSYEILEKRRRVRRQVGRGRPGPHTKYATEIKTEYELSWDEDREAIARAEMTDGVFPLVTNTDWEATRVLETYKGAFGRRRIWNNAFICARGCCGLRRSS